MLSFRSLIAKNWAFLAGFGIICVIIGIILAANLDLSTPSTAQVNKSQKEAYSPSNSKSPFIYVAEKVSPAVVNISAKSIEEGRYHQGEFFSRDNIHPGMVSFHPVGFTHGPHPKALKNAFEQKSTATDEVAVMIDARDALEIDPAAVSIEWDGYVDSWRPGD